ncbi:unnamed protein product [Protopolystoma xenopodis]|uniref:Uncharacterized protein n=1 Tax=Protopolystoma xenopodis TaxID=117903 RepID=A0A3S5B3Z6_9PLAT|nr:unnamed protein product [Protopolystoma xenopodis]
MAIKFTRRDHHCPRFYSEQLDPYNCGSKVSTRSHQIPLHSTGFHWIDRRHLLHGNILGVGGHRPNRQIRPHAKSGLRQSRILKVPSTRTSNHLCLLPTMATRLMSAVLRPDPRRRCTASGRRLRRLRRLLGSSAARARVRPAELSQTLKPLTLFYRSTRWPTARRHLGPSSTQPNEVSWTTQAEFESKGFGAEASIRTAGYDQPRGQIVSSSCRYSSTSAQLMPGLPHSAMQHDTSTTSTNAIF